MINFHDVLDDWWDEYLCLLRNQISSRVIPYRIGANPYRIWEDLSAL